MLLLLYRVYLRDFNMKLKWGSSLLLMGYLLPGPEVYLKMVFTLSLTTSPLLFFLLKKERKKEISTVQLGKQFWRGDSSCGPIILTHSLCG